MLAPLSACLCWQVFDVFLPVCVFLRLKISPVTTFLVPAIYNSIPYLHQVILERFFKHFTYFCYVFRISASYIAKQHKKSVTFIVGVTIWHNDTINRRKNQIPVNTRGQTLHDTPLTTTWLHSLLIKKWAHNFTLVYLYFFLTD